MLSRRESYVVANSDFNSKTSFKFQSPFPVGSVVTYRQLQKVLEENPSIVQPIVQEKQKSLESEGELGKTDDHPLPSKILSIPLMANPKDSDFLENATGQIMQIKQTFSLAEALKPLFSNEEIFAAQQVDEFCAHIKENLKNNPKFEIDAKGTLMFNSTIQGNHLKTVVVPVKLQSFILAFFHVDNHCGGLSLSTAIGSKYYWPNLRNSCHDFVAGCHFCNVYRAQANPETKLGDTQDYIPRIKATCWSLDIIEGFTSYKNFNGQILCLSDHYSHFRVIRPLKKSTGLEIAKIMEEVICTFSVSMFISDQGSNLLNNKEVKKLLDRYGVKSHVTVAYSGKSHGHIEASHKAVTALLRMCIEQHQTLDWPSLIPYIQKTLNEKKLYYLNNYSPYQIMFGLEPMNIRLKVPSEDEILAGPKEIMKKWETENSKVKEIVDTHYQRLQKEYSKKKLKPRSFPVNSFIYYRDQRPNVPKKKMKQRYFQTPLLILEERPQTVLAKTFDGRILRLHKDHCKKASPRSEEAFGKLPTKVKMVLGEPFSYEDLKSQMEGKDIPLFFKNKESIPNPEPMTTRSKTKANSDSKLKVEIPSDTTPIMELNEYLINNLNDDNIQHHDISQPLETIQELSEN